MKAAYDIRAKREKIWASNTWLYASSGIHMGNFDLNHGMRGPFLGALIHLSECTVLSQNTFELQLWQCKVFFSHKYHLWVLGVRCLLASCAVL